MDSSIDYFQKLYDDLIEQFKGKPKITIFQKAMARQLEEVYAFFYELRIMRWLQNAEGVQLDGIGNIVDLSRTDALIWSNLAGQTAPMDDELYRLYLWFKIFLNTSRGTYKDIVKSLRMFWPDSPIFYSEYLEHPATMFFTTPEMPMNTDMRILQIVTRVKAAGVALHFIIPKPADEDTVDYYATAGSVWLRQYIICDNPFLPVDTYDYYGTAGSVFTREYIIADNMPLHGDVEDMSSTAANQFIKEVYAE